MKAASRFKIARIAAIIFLIWALDRHPYGYYTLLSFVICGVSAYGVLVESRELAKLIAKTEKEDSYERDL